MRLIGLAVVLTLNLVLAPLAAVGQQAGNVYRIGILASSPPGPEASPGPFRTRLAELGYTERTIQYEFRYAEGRPDRFPALAADLVRLKVNVIVTGGGFATKAAMEATTTIPIVFQGITSPVAGGYVASLARPGGNVTGVTDQGIDIGVKRLQLLSETVPKHSRIGWLVDFSIPDVVHEWQEVNKATQRLGIELVPVEVRRPEDLEPAFVTLSRERARAIFVRSTPALSHLRGQVAALALKNRLPTLGISRAHAEAGLLMSYGPLPGFLGRRAADYVDRILKGAKPADLPVEQPTRFELVINLKTAKALGLTIPQSLLLRVDQVIE
jgi:putative ABC transport system substrate-binding protein